MAKQVKVYSTDTCPWCVKAKDFLRERKVKFVEANVATDEKARNELIEKSGQLGVPVIEITGDGEPVIIVGFDKEALIEALK